MDGRIILTGARKPLLWKWHLCLLILLGMTVVCSGQRSRTGTTGRSRTSRSAPLKVIQLPAPRTSSAESVEAILSRQQNLEAPANLRLTFSEIGQLAWAVQGVTVSRQAGAIVPDAMLPMKIYFALPDGIYLYIPSTHALRQLRDTDVRSALAGALLNQQGVPVGGCQVILTGSTAAFSTRYGKRGKTAMLLLAGQMAQSLQLQALSLDLTYIAINSVDTLGIRRICRFDRTLTPLYVVMVGYPASRALGTVSEESATPVAKKVVIITPQRDFEDQELFQTKLAFDAVAVESRLASVRSGRVVGRLGSIAQADLGLADVNVDDFDAFIFIGGPGALTYAANARLQGLVREVVAQRKILGASGTAPVILAKAGALKGAKATSLATQGQALALAGVTYTGAPVEKDGLVVTSTGAQVAPQFVRVILGLLADQ